MDITYKPKELKPVKNGKEMDTIFLDKEFERKNIITYCIKFFAKKFGTMFFGNRG